MIAFLPPNKLSMAKLSMISYDRSLLFNNRSARSFFNFNYVQCQSPQCHSSVTLIVTPFF